MIFFLMFSGWWRKVGSLFFGIHVSLIGSMLDLNQSFLLIETSLESWEDSLKKFDAKSRTEHMLLLNKRQVRRSKGNLCKICWGHKFILCWQTLLKLPIIMDKIFSIPFPCTLFGSLNVSLNEFCTCLWGYQKFLDERF